MEVASSGMGCRGVRVCGGHWSQHATGRCEVTPCQDRRADAGERFFGSRARQSRPAERKAMIDRTHDLPISRQAKALSISRGSVYYLPQPVSATDLDEADGDRGALSPSSHDQARAWPQGVSISAARCSDHATESGVGDGYHLHPDGAWLRLPGRCARLVQSVGSVVARRSRWKRLSASRRWRRRW